MTPRILFLIFLSLTLVPAVKAQNNYNEVSLPELMKKKRQGDKNMVIVDVRTNAEYYDSAVRNMQSNIGRIKGAITLPLQDLEQNPDAVKQLDAYRDKDIYLICSHSYRSRAASNILLKNGFAHVNNVRGGMTEWYRRYDELSPYRDDFFEKGVIYTNLSPSQLLAELVSGKDVLLLGIRTEPKYWYDSFNLKLFRYYPQLKKTVYYNYTDSLKVLEAVQNAKGKPVVLFNKVNYGAAELTDWLTRKGFTNVSYLVGGENLFYEYVQNKKSPAQFNSLIVYQNTIHFISPVGFCQDIAGNKNFLMVDVRPDSLFNKVNEGTKHDYKHLKDFSNFFAGDGAQLFQQKYPDKNKAYLLVSENGISGLEFAYALTKAGYKIHWLIGGLNRWEWYMNNVEDFGCNSLLVE